MIRIINYDAGNILNVYRAFKQLGVEAVITDDLSLLNLEKDVLVLPGVGSFGATMSSLNKLKLTNPIISHISNGGKFLGICLGLQLLYDESEESPGEKGLCVFPGKMRKFSKETSGKVPQIGWNTLKVNHPFFSDFDNKYFYFVHSYYAPFNQELILAFTTYGISFNSAIVKDKVIAVQFHPEKSGKIGLAFLQKTLDYLTI